LLTHVKIDNQNLENEIKIIKNSFIFKMMKKIARITDHISKTLAKTESGKIIIASGSMIKNNGIKGYTKSVKEKIERREFRILSEIETSSKDELLRIVKNN